MNEITNPLPPRPGNPPPRPGNGMAVAALVLGIIAAVFAPWIIWLPIVFPCGVLAIVFGAVGRGRHTGRTMATWGLALGICAVALNIGGCAACAVVLADENRDAMSEIYMNEISEIYKEVQL